MARQQVEEEEGWPLGLQPLNVRVVGAGIGGGGVGINRGRDYLGSMSFNNTLLSGSPPTSSTDSSSDLDTESTGSFFHDRSITLGSLIGVSSILDLSRRSLRGRRTSAEPLKAKKPYKSRTWFFSLCSRDSTDVVKDPTNPTNNPPSLGHFLAVERRSGTTTTTNNNSHERNTRGYDNNNGYAVPDDFSMAQPCQEMNSLFVNGSIAPLNHQDNQQCRRVNDQSSPRGNRNKSLEHGIPVLFLCNCSH